MKYKEMRKHYKQETKFFDDKSKKMVPSYKNIRKQELVLDDADKEIEEFLWSSNDDKYSWESED